MELNKNFEIKILSVENPGQFWFRTVTDEKHIQDALKQYEQENRNTNCDYVPQNGDLIIIRLLNTFSVVRVERLLNENKIATFFLENGRKEIVQRGNVVRLSDKSLGDEVLNTIRMGKISDILPLEKTFDRKFIPELKRSMDNEWSTESIEIFRNHIEKSSGAFFQATSVDGSCYSGKLTFVIDFSQILIGTSCAVSCSTKLENGYANDFEHEHENGHTSDHTNDQTKSQTNGYSNGNKHENECLSDKESLDDNSDVRPVISLANHKIKKDANDKPEQTSSPNEKSKNSTSSSSAVSGSVEISEKLSQWTSSPSSNSDKSNDNTFFHTFPDDGSDVLSVLYQKKTTLTPITERTGEDDEDISSNSEIPSYYLEDSESEDDGKQYEYQWSPEKEKERQIDASNALKKQMIDALLKDAVLSANEPFTFCHEPNDILNELFCEDYFESLKEHNKLYPAQPLVWRYISIATSTILIGNTEYYPHLLYLPPIISMIRMKKITGNWNKDEKVIIFASNCKEAMAIRRICYAFLEDNSVYTDAEDYSLSFDEKKYTRCDIFISLMSRLCPNPKENLPIDAYFIVLNNFESIEKEIRKEIVRTMLDSKLKFLITSRYNVDELRVCFDGTPNAFLSIESYFDAFHMSVAKGPRSFELIESKQKFIKLKTQLEAKNKVVVVCNHDKDAKDLSRVLEKEQKIEIDVNKNPRKGSRLLICSDDRLDNITVQAANHIVHFELPNDFETFSRRYAVMRKQFKFQSNVPKGPTSTILVSHEQFVNNSILLLHLLYRYDLCVTVKHEKSLSALARFMNGDAPLCIDTALSFVNFDHLIECRNRHFFKDVDDKVECLFTEPKECQLEILQVLSPTWFSIRIMNYKDVGSTDWLEYHSSGSFEQFNTELDQFYANAFDPIQNASDLVYNIMYVFRDGDKFSRCRVMVNKVDGVTENVRVRLVDFGELRNVNISNIGRLNECHADFPLQSIDLYILGLMPWNKSGWTEHDTNYASDILMGRTSNEIFGKGRYKTIIQWEIGCGLVFAFNLFKSNDEPQNHFDKYVDFITSKGIASKTTAGLENLFEHAMDVKLLTIDQWNRIKNFLL